MKFMCPAMHLSRYKCCPLMNVVAPVGSFDDKMEGQLEEYGDKPVERVCKLTKCKSSITKEAKCSHGKNINHKIFKLNKLYKTKCIFLTKVH